MRIVGGIYKRRRFDVPKNFKARPTTDFAKENLFNVINNLTDLEGLEALDLFAGTGNISFELLSRGCAQVTCVEKDRVHHAFIKKVAAELKTDALSAINGDVFKYVESCKQSFDFIFADPPYALNNLDQIPQLIIANNLLKPNGIFILEHPKEYDFSALPDFRQRRIYGSVNFSLFVSDREN